MAQISRAVKNGFFLQGGNARPSTALQVHTMPLPFGSTPLTHYAIDASSSTEEVMRGRR